MNRKRLEDVKSHLRIMHTWASYDVERQVNTMTQETFESMAQWTMEALELLEEMEPVKPRIVKDGFSEGRDKAYCGNCGMGIRIGGPTRKNATDKCRDYYCGFCGKPVKWE